MALIIEDGTGKVDAESYASVSDASTYFTAYDAAFAATWGGLATGVQEEALRNATQYIENRYRGRWKGCKETKEQALAFPRVDLCDEDGYEVSGIPVRLLQATAEAAKRAYSADLEPDLTVDRNIASESRGLDVLRKSVSYIGAKPTEARFTVIDRLLSSYLNAGAGMTTAERG